jgi:hypothetical protein
MELEQIMQESAETLEKDFYLKKFYFSYSSLNKLMWNPAVFYQMYILGIKEERTDSHLVQGKIVHALLLEEEKFNDNFIISPSKLPGDSVKIVIDRVFAHYQELAQNGDTRSELNHFDQAILDVMVDMNYHQSLKTDQQRLDKIISPESTSYWSFLKTKGNKTLIDQDSYEFCKNAVELVKTDKDLCSLIGCNITEFDNVEVYNEIPLSVEHSKAPFGIKGIIDNVVINHDKKTIFINDIKTTSKDLKDFPETIEFYSYWLQAVMYCTLVAKTYKELIEINGYEMKFHFVVIDRAFQTYPFLVTESTLKRWFNRMEEVLEAANWHYVNKRYDLPHSFATGSVVL